MAVGPDFKAPPGPMLIYVLLVVALLVVAGIAYALAAGLPPGGNPKRRRTR